MSTPSEDPAGTAAPAVSGPRRDVFQDMRVAVRQLRSDDVTGVLRDMILSGQLRPGDQLPSERDLAVRLQVSRATMREAIRHLGTQGLVTVRQGKGTFVSRISDEDLARPLALLLAMDPPTLVEVVEFRRVIEPGVAALAAGRATDAQRAELTECLAEGRRALTDDDAMIAHDAEFHRLISVAARNRFLLAASANLAESMLRARRRTVHLPANNQKTVDEHQTIADAIIAGRADEASAAMARHLDRVLDQLQQAFPDDAPR
ncbi:MAG: FadR/GntR family transcriptional regulator [Actinocatenispora sp.]